MSLVFRHRVNPLKNSALSAEQYHEILSDPKRLKLLKDLDMVDSPGEDVFDRLTRLASQLLPTPISLVSLVDHERQYFKSHVGLQEPWASMRQTPLTHSFCQHVVVSGKPLIVEDAREHPLVKENLAIPNLGVVSYLGMPLTTRDGVTLGSFCVIDSEVRRWTAHDISTVHVLAQSVMAEIELRSEYNALKAAEAALRESEERYRSVVAAMADGIVMQDSDGKIVACNASAERILGLSLDQMAGRTSTDPMWRAVHEDGSAFPGEDHPIVTTLKTGESQHDVIMGVHKPDGILTWMRINTEALWREDEDEPFAAVASFSDITQLKATLSERDELIENLDSFAHTVAHDLKNPIGQILGFANVLASAYDELPREDMLMYLGTMEKTAIRMGNIVESLLMLASIRQQQDVPAKVVDLSVIVAEVLERLDTSIKEADATIELREPLMSVIGYAPWVEEVLVNYVSNALKYGGRPPRVTIGAEADTDSQIRVWVRDNGQGLTPDEQAQLFVPFTRITQANIEGHGLGLSIVRQIVERLGGDVAVRSDVGQGSEFSFTLPAAHAELLEA